MKRLMQFAICRKWYIGAGVLLGTSFLFPETLTMAVLGCAAMAAAAYAVQTERLSSARGLFLCGVVAHLVGFYWLPDTLTFFGGFPYAASLLLFLLYAVVSALQFALCGLVYDSLRSTMLGRWRLAFAASWLSAEYAVPRLFPWALAHTQSVWTSFSAWAEVGGTALLSLPLLWWVSLAVALIRGALSRRLLLAGCVLLLLMSVGGFLRSSQIREALAGAQGYRFALIQGNLAALDKGDVRKLDVNIGLYQAMSEQAAADGADVIVWPESVASFWTPGELARLRGTRYDPAPLLTTPFIYGGLSFEQRSLEEQERILSAVREEVDDEFRDELRYRFHNSAFALTAEGELIGRYDKRVLMPLGEYLPFARIYPSVRALSPHTGNFDVGLRADPLMMPIEGKAKLSIMPLICYEDLIPGLSRDAVLRGADVLLNLTNDAWYGETAAPFQHHLLALWRAIETRRFLVRSTNTGYTAVVNPLGETVAGLPIFSEGVLLADVRALEVETLYVRFGDKIVQILTMLILGSALAVRLRMRGQA